MEKVVALKDGEWIVVDITDLKCGDQFWHTDSVVQLVKDPEQTPLGIQIEVSKISNEDDPDRFPGDEYPGIAHAMELTGADLASYTDGTVQICRFDGDAAFFSPRLPTDELNEFCQANMGKYKDFFSTHKADINADLPVKMNQWWLN